MRKHASHSAEAKRGKTGKKQWKPPRLKTVPIIISKRPPIACLQASYGVSGQGVTRIHALTAEGQQGKEQFQRDAWRYAHALGQALALYGGFTEKRITKNRGSTQDAGSILAAYYHPQLPCWLSVYIESDPTKTALPRDDGVILIACRRMYRRTRERERMYHLNPAMSSVQLAQVLLLLVGLKKPGDFEGTIELPSTAGLQQQALFDEPRLTGADDEPLPQAGEGQGLVVRVLLLGAYRQCMLLRRGRSTVEVACIDDHPCVALAYWGKRITQPLLRVHPDDQALCALPGAEFIPGQAHLAPGNRG
jgi:hypothetical protein